MTYEERDQLTRFLQLLVEAQAGPKDPDADRLIREAFAAQPDAAYLLVQRVMQLEHALKDASEREAARSRSFVGDANSWGRAPVASQPSAAPGAINPATPMGQAPLGQAPIGQAPLAAPQSRWGSGLMGTVASTAVGVVAGSMLAQGIGSLFGGHHDQQKAFDPTANPPGSGTLVETDYGSGSRGADDGGYVADDFDPGDTGDVG